MSSERISRKQALDEGLLRYFTGEECKWGHISERWVSSGSCVECAIERTKEYRERGCTRKSPTIEAKPLPSLDILKESFDYNQDTGELFWKTRPRSHFSSLRGHSVFNATFAGKVAGHAHTRNFYIEVRLMKKLYKAHRVIWKMVTGEDPKDMIDHIDGDPSNNRFENLRICTNQENSRNAGKPRSSDRTSRYMGVGFQRNRWVGSITVNGKPIVRKFGSELEAALWYDEMATTLFGKFAKLNFPDKTLGVDV